MNNFIVATEKIWNINNYHKHFNKEGWFLVTNNKLLEGTANTLNPKMIFFPHWSSKIPKEIYEKYECVMFHMTDLPTGKGKEPLQWLIESGKEETTLTVFRCTDEMDAGLIYYKEPLSLAGSAEEVYIRCSRLIFIYIKMMANYVDDNGMSPSIKQQVGKSSECGHPTEEILLDAIDDLPELYNKIRSWDAESYPKAYIDLDDFSFEFSNSVMKHDCIEALVKIRIKE